MSHRQAARRVIEQFGDPARQRGRGGFAHVEGRIAGRSAALFQIEKDLGLAERHIFQNLVHGAVMIIRVGRVGRNPQINRRQSAEEKVIQGPAGQIDKFA